MRILISNMLFVFCLFFLVSCQLSTSIQEGTQESKPEVQVTEHIDVSITMEPYIFMTSEPRSAIIHGELVVMDPTMMLPDQNNAIFLVPLAGNAEGVKSIPTFSIGEVPQAEVDERTGEYTFTNIQPGQYAIVVLTTFEAQIPARFYKDGSYAIITVSESDRDQTIELDYIRLP